MRGIAVSLVSAVLLSTINGVLMFSIGGFWMTLWGLTFSVALPALAIAQAIRFSRDDQDMPKTRRPSLLVLGSVILAHGAMFPFIQHAWEHAEMQVWHCE